MKLVLKKGEICYKILILRIEQGGDCGKGKPATNIIHTKTKCLK